MSGDERKIVDSSGEEEAKDKGEERNGPHQQVYPSVNPSAGDELMLAPPGPRSMPGQYDW